MSLQEAEPAELQFARRIERWRRDPVQFVWEVGGERLWSKQKEIARSVAKNPRTAVPSAHGMGKSRLASWLAWWWVLCHRTKRLSDGSIVPATSKVVITAPSFGSLKNILGANIIARWDEMRARLPKEVADLLGLGNKPTQGGWTAPWSADCGIEWFSTREDEGKDTGHASKAAGRHSDHLLFIFEEFGGVEKAIYDSVQGSLAGEHRHFLGIGNPVDPTSVFAKCCLSKDFNTVRVSWYDFPNIKEGKNVLPYGPTIADLERFKRDPGEDSGEFQWKVLGLFPATASDTLISHAVFEAARNRKPKEGCIHQPQAIALGCDVARFGDDDSVVFVICRDCGGVVDLEVRHGQDTIATGSMNIGMAVGWDLNKADAKQIAVDCGGGDVGAGVVDFMKLQGWNPKAVGFGEKASTETAQKKFVNRRTELWVGLRDWLRDRASLAGLKPEDIDRLRDECCSVRTDYDPKTQRRRLESKDDLKARIGRSPDRADALALAVCALRPVVTQQGAGGSKVERDPYWEKDHAPRRENSDVIVGEGKSRDISHELGEW